MKTILKFFAVAACAASLSACAAGRSVVTLDQAKITAPAQVQSVAVKIVQVTDARAFEEDPPNPSDPSLSSDDLHDAGLKARAIGRKRNGYGMAMGEVMLPEGSTVSGVIRTAVANGFREAGYRVVEAGQDGFDQARPVSLRIEQYWCWFQPGFFGVTVHNKGRIDVTGPLPNGATALVVQSGAKQTMMAVTEDDWQKIASEGLASLTANTAAALQGKPQKIVSH
ncbi:hypothetical protein GALL_221360 [mine drainage metagenome]|uniref:Flagellar biosynthesis protein n=1 Tax=mine drainage metagenome TaxID=410659 RepID=A0A1J5RK72_9ZZZZ